MEDQFSGLYIIDMCAIRTCVSFCSLKGLYISKILFAPSNPIKHCDTVRGLVTDNTALIGIYGMCRLIGRLFVLISHQIICFGNWVISIFKPCLITFKTSVASNYCMSDLSPGYVGNLFVHHTVNLISQEMFIFGF